MRYKVHSLYYFISKLDLRMRLFEFLNVRFYTVAGHVQSAAQLRVHTDKLANLFSVMSYFFRVVAICSLKCAHTIIHFIRHAR